MINSSEWKEFRIGDLFDIKTTSQKLSKKDSVENGKFPIYSAESQNGGICGYCNEIPAFTISNEKTFFVIFGDHTRAFNIAKNDFCVADNVKVLEPKNFNIKSILFIITIWQKGIPNLGYARHWSIAKNIQIKLPTTQNGEIDFNFMESFIDKIEQKQRGILEFYKHKKQNGGGYELNSRIWQEFKIGDLFLVKNNPQLNKSSFNFSKNGKYPYFTRTVFNNGILGYVDYLDEEHKIKGNSIAVGMIAMKFFYMKQDFYAGQFTKTIYPKFDNFNDKIAKYFISIFNKNTPLYLKNFVVKDFEKDFTNTTIKLPITTNGEIDFDFMESFIKAIQKECIKGVDSYLSKNIATTKELIK